MEVDENEQESQPQEKSVNQKSVSQVHSVKFYKIKPRPIQCLAYSPTLRSLAVSRDDSTIELWNLRYTPFLERVMKLPETPAEGLAWAGERLFSVDFSGKLIEWDIEKLQPRQEYTPTGNALWCLDINPDNTELAVGTEEGHINILSLENDEITYKSIFQKMDSRVLCCKFNRTGQRLVTGSVGAVRIWDVARGVILHTMTLSARDTIVCTVLVLQDDTIIAGDSMGLVTVWEGKHASQVQCFKVLDKNIFGLAISDKQDRLVISGMDPPMIRVMAKTEIKRDDYTCHRWVKSFQQMANGQYVKALVTVRGRVVCGGADGFLSFTSVAKQIKAIKYAPFLRGPCASVAPTANLLLLRYPQRLELWRLGVPADDMEGHLLKKYGQKTQVMIAELPEKLLELKSNFVLAAAISPDSNWICYSTVDEVRLSRLNLNPLTLQRISEGLPSKLNGASHIIFHKSNLFLLHADKPILSCLTMSEDSYELAYDLELDAVTKSHITLLEISPNGKYAVLADVTNLISVWELNGKESKHSFNLPVHKVPATALAVHYTIPSLVIAYANGQIMEYDLLERAFTAKSYSDLIPEPEAFAINRILLDPRNTSVVLGYSSCYVFVLRKEKAGWENLNTDEPNSKKRHMSQRESSRPLRSYRYKYRMNQDRIVDLVRMGPNEIVQVGINHAWLKEAAGPTYQRKHFNNPRNVRS